MNLEVSGLRRQVGRRLRRFEEMVSGRAVTQRPAEEATPEELVEQRSERHASLEAAELACLPEDERTVDPAAVERVADSIRHLEGQRRLYSRLLNQAYELIPDDAHGGALHFWQGNTGDAIDKLIQAASMHEEWTRQILELRSLYRAAGVPEREWKVKPSANAPPRRLDPDITRLLRYYLNIQEWLGEIWSGTPTWGYRETAARWRNEANY